MAASGGSNLIAERYASALFELADDSKALDAVADDLKSVTAALDQSGELARLVHSPVLSRADQSKAIAALLERLGAHKLTRNVVGLMARNRRLPALAGVARAYLEELARRRGEVTAEVVSASALSKEDLAAVEAAVKKAIGGKIALVAKTDPGLIGGLIVKVGSRMVDASLKTQLTKLKLAMKGA